MKKANNSEVFPSPKNWHRFLEIPSVFLIQQDIGRTTLNAALQPDLKNASLEGVPPPATLDHLLVDVKSNSKPKRSPDMSLYRTIFRYTKADRGSISSYIEEPSLSIFFKHINSKTTSPSQNGSFLDWRILYPRKNAAKIEHLKEQLTVNITTISITV